VKTQILVFSLLVASLQGCDSTQNLGSNTHNVDVSCLPNETNCDGACSALNDDAHCGSCDNACAQGQHCGNGSCFTCPADASNYCPSANGGGSCSNLTTDNLNCGWCGHQCAFGDTCTNGSCVSPQGACSQGQVACGDVCTTLGDDAHCGSCDNACAQGQHCGNGYCFTCPADASNYCPYPNGGGSCSNLTTDNLNCGWCGHRCASGQTCKNGACG
jgi:hypothetical protein